MGEKKGGEGGSSAQAVWGAMLVAMGLAVFVRIPQVDPKLQSITQIQPVLGFIKFCLYFMGVVLFGGGARKLWAQYRLFFGRAGSAGDDVDLDDGTVSDGESPDEKKNGDT